MKVKIVKEPQFKPITIMLENEDEAKLFWAVLDRAHSCIELPKDWGNLKTKMWETFNKVYDPRIEKDC